MKSKTPSALTASTLLLGLASAKLQFGGINIAGFDFGCGTDGTCSASGAYPPLTQYYGADGARQMKHFVADDGFNAFRLPTSWQFMVNDQLGAPINETNAAKYDDLVQACIDAGASMCLIDIHNYARWNGKVIGQGGPTNDQFASFWGELAGRYADNSKIAFGIMNEPHDLPDIPTWADTVQAAVTAIRNAGASSQYILLPGDGYTSAETFVSSGSADALNKVTNPDGSKDYLIMDVHKYLDSDNSGTAPECVKNNIDNAFAPLAAWLRENGRVAFNSETGGGNTDSCITYLGQQLAYLSSNSDVYLGFTSWAAGNFVPGYPLCETPVNNTSGGLDDQTLVSKCIQPAFAAS